MENTSEFVVYILYAEKYNKYYVGYTSHLIERMKSHNFLGHGFTKRYRPWVVIHVEFFTSKTEALQREKFLKSGKGRAWRKNNLNL